MELESSVEPGNKEDGIGTMSTETSMRLGELDDKNWKSWSLKFRSYLRLLDLWDVVNKEVPKEADQDATWKKNDMKALDLIMLKVSDTLTGLVSKSEHAHDAYQVLKQHFEGSGNSKMACLFDRLFQLKTSPPATIGEIAREFAMVRDEILELDVKQEEFYGYYFLHILPEQYQQAATSLKAVGKVTFESARDFLIQEDRKMEASVATLAAMKRKPKLKLKGESGKNFPCHNCGDCGHFRKDCPYEDTGEWKEFMEFKKKQEGNSRSESKSKSSGRSFTA